MRNRFPDELKLAGKDPGDDDEDDED